MGLIGDLVVRLKTDDKQFRDGIQKSENKVRGFSKFMLSAAGIAGAVIVFRKLISVGKDLVKAYEVQETAETKLRAALKATGNAVGITADEMFKYAKEMQSMTTFGDEAIIGAQALMTTFTQIGKETFPDAIEAAADMSTMFGQDLQQSVIQLGTALNDPIAGVGRLKRIGISFTEDQRESIKQFVAQNDVMSAQQVILDELKREIGGVSKEMGETAIGSMKRYGNAMSDLKEMGGEALLEFLQPMIVSMTNLAVRTLQAWDAQRNLNKAFEGEATTLQDAKDAFQENQLRLNKLNEELVTAEKRLKNAGSMNLKLGGTIQDNTARLKVLIAEEETQNAMLLEQMKRMAAEEKLRLKNVELTDLQIESKSEETEIIEEQNIALEEHMSILEALSVAAAELRDIEKEEAEVAEKAIEDKIESMRQMAEYISGPFIDAYSAGFEAFGESIVEGGNALQIFRNAFKETISGMLTMLGKYLALQAIQFMVPPPNPTFNPVSAALAGAAAAAAFTASGVVKALKEGGIVTQPTLALIGEAGPEKVTLLGAEPTHITVMLGSKVLYDDITKGIKNRQIRIEQTL